MVKEGYKQTEIGEIPKDWDVKSVNEIAEVKGGKRLPQGQSLLINPTTYPYIRVSDMENGKINTSNIMFVPEEIGPLIKNYRISSKDIFISVAGTLGLIGVIPNEYDGANLTENADKITNIKCNQKFLMYSLLSIRIQNEIESQKTLGAQPKLALGRIEKLLIPVPRKMPEQRAIAEALSDVDELIAGLEKLIAKKRAVKTAAMQQLLTGKTRLPGFSGEWVPLNFGKHVSLKARIGWQGLTTSEYLEKGSYYLVTGTDFKAGKIHWSTCSFVDKYRFDQDTNIQLKKDDVLITKDGTIGKVAYIDNLPDPATLNSGVFVIRPVNQNYNSLFLYYILSSNIFSEFLSKLSAGSTISHLYQKDFINFSFMAPSTEEQEQIGIVLAKIDDEISALETRLDKTRAIKQGMMQELLTGRTRLL